MDSNFKFKTSEPLKCFAKNFSFSLSFIFLISCKSTTESIPEKPYYSSGVLTAKSSPYGTQITSFGDNFSFSFSADESKILYSSRSRDSHKNTQIYELDLITMQERRITFSDGDATNAVYSGDGKGLFYASTTDEIKEQPERITGKKNDLPPSEIYLSSLSGDEIERITHNQGFDGELYSYKNDLYFTRLNGGQSDIYKLTGKLAVSFLSDKKINEKNFITNKHISAWIKNTADGDSIQVKQANKINDLGVAKGRIVLQQLTEKNILLFSSDNTGDSNGIFTAYLYDFNRNCLIRPLDFKQEIREAKITEDLTWIYFVANEPSDNGKSTGSGKQQIFKKKLGWDNLNCATPTVGSTN